MLKSTPWTIRYVIRSFSFNVLRRHPAMHIEGFNIQALEGAIHIARPTSFVAVAAVCIDKTNIFLTRPTLCIVQTKYVGPCPTQYILWFIASRRCARQCLLLRSIWLSSIPSICVVILDVLLTTIRIELPSLNYYSLGR